jgi:hypothetical protein
MSAESITDQELRPITHSISSLWIKHMLHLVQADVRIYISRLRAGKVPSGRGVSGPRTSMGGSRPDNKRTQGLAIGGNAFDGRDQRALHRGPSMLSQIIFANENLQGIENAKEDSRLVYIINILRENGGIGQLSANNGKPLLDFLFDLPAISLPVDCLQPSRFQFWMSFVKALRPILPRRLDLGIGGWDLENRRSLAHDDQGEGS